MSKTKSKNDIAWEKIFEDYSILDTLKGSDSFNITASQRNEYREARLMTKFDLIKIIQTYG